MKVIMIHGPGDVRVDDVARPETGPQDVLVKVAACGICGSDLTFVKLGGASGPNGPMPLGHELSGTVQEVGRTVHDHTPGSRVIVNPYINLIGNGGPDGGFANYVLVRDVAAQPGSLIAIPDNLSFEHAALAEPLAVALHCVNRGEIKPGRRVAIFGAGPIGLGVVVALKHRGIEDIAVIDYSDFRLERARALGARATINPAKTDVKQSLAALHGSAPHFSGIEVVNTDCFVDAAGSRAIIPSIIEMCRIGARLVVAAVYSEPIAFDLRLALTKELTVAMAMGYPHEFPEVVGMLARGEIDVEPIISHRFDLSRFTSAFETARDPANSSKVMVTIA